MINIICGVNKEVTDNLNLCNLNNLELYNEIFSYFELKRSTFDSNISCSTLIKWYLEEYKNSKNADEKNGYWNKYVKMLENRDYLLKSSVSKLKAKEFKIIELLNDFYVNKNIDEVVDFVLFNMKIKVNYSVFSKTFRELEVNSLMTLSKKDFQELILKYGKIKDNDDILNKESLDIYIPVSELEHNPSLKMIIMSLMGYGKGKIKRMVIQENNKNKRKKYI